MYYHVMITHRGDVQDQGVYKSADSAQRRADSIKGDGKVEVWGPSLTSSPKEAIQEYLMRDVK